MEKLETLLEWGGLKKEIITAGDFQEFTLLLSLFHIPLPFVDCMMVAVILVWCARLAFSRSA
ncbi:MAG: hypothetical protein ACLS6W_09665 [Ruminococcus sp.]